MIRDTILILYGLDHLSHSNILPVARAGFFFGVRYYCVHVSCTIFDLLLLNTTDLRMTKPTLLYTYFSLLGSY